MTHMTNDELYHIATLLSQEAPFEQEDIVLMQHIMACERCTANLKRATAIVDAMDHIAEVHMLAGVQEDAEESGNSAIIQIVVLDTKTLMEQVQKEKAQWLFDVPFCVGTKRSAEDEKSLTESLVDEDDSKTFVSYNQKKKALTIQIAGKDGDAPKAKLKEKNGTERRISFEKCGSVYRAEVSPLEQGEYELMLEK